MKIDRSESYQRVESILEKAGTEGVHRAHFLYDLHWSQIAARVSEMNDLGWVIESVHLPKHEWRNGIETKYILRSKPLQAGEDWYTHKTGKPRAPLAQPDPYSLFGTAIR